jgi:YVTN family beta-propeller protein
MAAGLAGTGLAAIHAYGSRDGAAPPLCVGTFITPAGSQTEVGSFPVNMAISPDGRWIVVTDTGPRQYLSVLSAADGRLASQIAFGAEGSGRRRRQPALYTGLAFGPGSDPKSGTFRLYAARGAEDRISIYDLGPDGKLADTGKDLDDPTSGPTKNFVAQFVFDPSGDRCYVTHNNSNAFTAQKGSIGILDTAANRALARPSVGGYPYAIAGPICRAGSRKLYVASERDAEVTLLDVTDAAAVTKLKSITTGDHPDALLLDRKRSRLFVANAGSDTVTVIDASSDSILDTILLRPPGMTVPGATPTSLALSPDGSRLYVTLADLNALAVVDLKRRRLEGYVPTGWYPTSVVVSADGKRLFVANAKGVRARQPNTSAWGPGGVWGHKDINILEGTVSMFARPSGADLRAGTRQVLLNNRIAGSLAHANDGLLKGAGIRHVIYVVKENRTYDQVLGDLKQGNGDPSVCLFPARSRPTAGAGARRAWPPNLRPETFF